MAFLRNANQRTASDAGALQFPRRARGVEVLNLIGIIPRGAKDLTIEAWITQTKSVTSGGQEVPSISLGMTKQRVNVPASSLHQQHRPAALDFARDFAVQMRGHAGDAAWKDFAAFGDEFFKEIGIFVINSLNGNIDPPTRHGAIRPAEGGTAFGCFRTHHFVSRCSVCRLRNGLYFFFSSRLGVRGLFLFRVVM